MMIQKGVSLGIFSAIGWCYDILAMIPPDALHVLDCLLVVCVIDSSRVIPISFISFTSVSCLFSSSSSFSSS